MHGKNLPHPRCLFWLGSEHKTYPFGACYKDPFLVYCLPSTLPFISSNTGTPVSSFLSGPEQHIHFCYLYA